MTKTTTRRENLRMDGALHPDPEKVKCELFTGNAFFDPEDIAQVKYEMLRSVHLEKLSITEASRKFGLSRPSYYQGLEQFEKHGLMGLVPLKSGPKQAHKLTGDVMSFIKEHLDVPGKRDWKKISQRIYDKFGKRVHPRSIERSIRLEKKTRTAAQ